MPDLIFPAVDPLLPKLWLFLYILCMVCIVQLYNCTFFVHSVHCAWCNLYIFPVDVSLNVLGQAFCCVIKDCWGGGEEVSPSVRPCWPVLPGAVPSAASSISSRLFLDLSSPASSPAGTATPSTGAGAGEHPWTVFGGNP